MWCKRIANVKLPFPCVSDGDAYATTSPLWWTLNSSWETIWSKQVFHQGLLFLHIWCLFKHLNARLGSLCLTAFAIFLLIWRSVLLGNDQQLSSWNWRSDCCQERPTTLTSFPPACVSLCTSLLIEMGLFSYLSSTSSPLCLALPKLAKLQSPAVLTNLHSLKTCGLPKYYLHSV